MLLMTNKLRVERTGHSKTCETKKHDIKITTTYYSLAFGDPAK